MVTVYTTSSCAFCPLVKQYLKSKNLDYKEVNVTEDQETRKKLFDLTGMMTVPVVTRGDRFVVGWKPSLLASLIA